MKGRGVKGEVICFVKLHVVRRMDAVHLLSFKKHMIFRTNHKSSSSTELLFLFKKKQQQRNLLQQCMFGNISIGVFLS